MKQRIITALVGGVVFLVAVYLLPPVGTLIIYVLLCCLAASEVVSIDEAFAKDKTFILSSAAFGGVVAYFGCVSQTVNTYIVAGVYTLFFIGYNLLKKKKIKLTSYVQSLFGVWGVPYLLSSLIRILFYAENGELYILLPVFIAWGTDIMAMNGGMLFGKHKLCPKISPKKTVEGAISGLLGGTLGALLMVWLFPQLGLDVGYMCLLGFVGSIIAQMGDLAMSMLKRANGVKDFGNIFPGHGGILDRFDSVMPVCVFVELALVFAGIM